MKHARDQNLWVASEVMPDGSYGVSVTVHADFAITLNREQSVAYAVACYRRATEVEHDTAVLRLLRRTGVDEKTAATVIVSDLRPDRPDDHSATNPIRYIGAIGRVKYPRPDAGEFVPLINMQLHGKDIGQLDPDELRDHAGGVLSVLAAADLDAALHRVLVHTIGLDDATARSTIGALFDLWPKGTMRPDT